MDELNVRKLLEKTSYPFLAAYENEWINADRKTLTFDEMEKEYLEHCYRYLLKQKESIRRGFFLQGVKFDKNQYKNIISITMELYNQKVRELEKYIG